MAQTVYERNKRDANKLRKTAKVGDVLYVVLETAEPYRGYDEPRFYTRLQVTHMHPILIGGMIGSLSVEGLVYRYGPVYTEQPTGMYGVHEERKDVFHPFGGDNDRRMPFNPSSFANLDQIAAEIRGR